MSPEDAPVNSNINSRRDHSPLRPLGLDNIAIHIGAGLAEKLCNPIDVPRDERPGAATQDDIVIRDNAGVAGVDVELTGKIVTPPTLMAATQPGDGKRPSSTTVLSAIRLLWMLSKVIRWQALVITTLFVTSHSPSPHRRRRSPADRSETRVAGPSAERSGCCQSGCSRRR
jgi:hypothetical protein